MKKKYTSSLKLNQLALTYSVSMSVIGFKFKMNQTKLTKVYKWIYIVNLQDNYDVESIYLTN